MVNKLNQLTFSTQNTLQFYFYSFKLLFCSLSARRSIYYDTQHPEGLEKIKALEAHAKYQPIEVEDKPVCKPYFISELRGVTEYAEGDSAHFEARVEPAHDSELKVEFYHNGKPLDAGKSSN